MVEVSAVYIARRADDVTTLVFHEPKLCLLIHLFFSQVTPLMYSADEGHTDVCRLLLENAADVNARNST
jgi:ankyrin repeat protein